MFASYAWNFIARRPDAKCFSYELASLDRCYDLSRDPDERHPLAPTGEYAALWEAARAHGEFFFAGTSMTAKPRQRPDVDPERARKLRTLGYLE